MVEKSKKLEDDIPSHYAEKFGNIAKDAWKHDDFRNHVLKIVEGREDSVQFMDKVQKYAGREIDARLFTSLRYYLTAVVTAVLTSVIGLVVGKYLLK